LNGEALPKEVPLASSRSLRRGSFFVDFPTQTRTTEMSDDRVINASEIPTRLEEDQDGHATITPEHTIADVLRYLIRTNSYSDVLDTLLRLGVGGVSRLEVETEVPLPNPLLELTKAKKRERCGDENG
jgi:hypothetical protein